ncbi:hypothetical protein ABZU45_36675 [Streptomyces avermitilis]
MTGCSDGRPVDQGGAEEPVTVARGRPGPDGRVPTGQRKALLTD